MSHNHFSHICFWRLVKNRPWPHNVTVSATSECRDGSRPVKEHPLVEAGVNSYVELMQESLVASLCDLVHEFGVPIVI